MRAWRGVTGSAAMARPRADSARAGPSSAPSAPSAASAAASAPRSGGVGNGKLGTCALGLGWEG